MLCTYIVGPFKYKGTYKVDGPLLQKSERGNKTVRCCWEGVNLSTSDVYYIHTYIYMQKMYIEREVQLDIKGTNIHMYLHTCRRILGIRI